jgi:hypothetical protein
MSIGMATRVPHPRFPDDIIPAENINTAQQYK